MTLPSDFFSPINGSSIFSSVMGLFSCCFSFVRRFLEHIKITENVSAWNYIIALFIGMSIISIVLRAFGGDKVMGAGGAEVANNLRESKRSKSNTNSKK